MADRDQLDRGFSRLEPEARALIVLHHYLDLPSSLERWLRVQSTFSGRIAPMGRLAWCLVAIALIVLAATVLLLAGVGQRRLPHFGSAANGAILFVDGTDLKIAGADGAKVRTAGTLPAGVESLTFSPDGLRLAYRTTGTPASIVIADVDGTNPLDVTIGATVAASAQVATGGPFAWSPNSKQLAFARNVAAGQRTIDPVNADGSHLTQLIPDSSSGPSDSYDPAWSPDGAWISYFATEPAGFVGINVIRPDGRDARRLPTSVVNPDDVEMSWSPDPARSRLAYVTGGYVKIFDLVTNADTVVGDGYLGVLVARCPTHCVVVRRNVDRSRGRRACEPGDARASVSAREQLQMLRALGPRRQGDLRAGPVVTRRGHDLRDRRDRDVDRLRAGGRRLAPSPSHPDAGSRRPALGTPGAGRLAHAATDLLQPLIDSMTWG